MDAESYARKNIKWLGHAGFRIDGENLTVYVDPWNVRHPRQADFICITHSHRKHLSPEDVQRILDCRGSAVGLRGVRLNKAPTVILGPADCKIGFEEMFHEMAPGWTFQTELVTIKAVPAYNVASEFHPMSQGWVGYLITMDGHTIYHAGDTDSILPMATIRADIALLPIGGTRTMNPHDAAKVAEKIRARVVIPMQSGEEEGRIEHLDVFSKTCQVPVLHPEPEA